MNKKKWFIWLGLVLFCASACQNKDKTGPAENSDYRGEQKLEKFSMVETLAGKTQWELEASRADVFETEKRTKLEKIKLKFFKDNKLTSVLIAEKGDINTETGDMQAVGNVVFSSEQEQVKVESEQLNWDNKRKKILTDSFVKETRPQGVVTGYGLEADPDLSRSVIKREVKAQVIQPEKKK
jgi:LPS export ABC transporter protein LptC